MKLIFVLFFSLHLFSQSKKDLSIKAQKDFLNLHFFENGRGMTISPNISKYLSMFRLTNDDLKKIPRWKKSIYKKILEDRYGLNVLDDQVAGLFNVKYKNMDVGVLGCVACHGGKAAGQFVAGLGNKIVDVYKIGVDAKRIQSTWGRFHNNPDFKEIHKVAMNFSNVISDSSISNLTRGLIPDSVIKTYFYKEAGVDYKGQISRAQVKVPHLWGLKEKRKTGIFWGAEFNGDEIGWEFGAELFASDSAEHFKAVLPKLRSSVKNIVYKFQAPEYPFEVDEKLAAQGKKIFNTSCFKCHGVHNRGLDGYPIYHQPKFIPVRVSKTDDDRLKDFDRYIGLVQSSSVSDILKLNIRKEMGYVAPNLWGIWSRFPYLHNASVPTLDALMREPQKRPQVFSMFDAGEKYRFDQKKIGLTLPKRRKQMLAKAKAGDRNIYYTKREGHSNSGHYYKFMAQFTENDIKSLVEYMKTL